MEMECVAPSEMFVECTLYAFSYKIPQSCRLLAYLYVLSYKLSSYRTFCTRSVRRFVQTT